MDLLVNVIMALCTSQGFPHELGETNKCEEWYVNCIVNSKGKWNVKDIDRCKDEKSPSFKLSE